MTDPIALLRAALNARADIAEQHRRDTRQYHEPPTRRNRPTKSATLVQLDTVD